MDNENTPFCINIFRKVKIVFILLIKLWFECMVKKTNHVDFYFEIPLPEPQQGRRGNRDATNRRSHAVNVWQVSNT